MENVLIVISLATVIDDADNKIAVLLPAIEIDEISDMTDKAINLLLNNFFVSLDNRDTRLLGDCFQGLIDYLSYSGIAEANSFEIINKIEMQLLSTLLKTIPFLENQELIKIKEYKIFSRKDLVIHAKINKQHPSHSNTGVKTPVLGPAFINPSSKLYPV